MDKMLTLRRIRCGEVELIQIIHIYLLFRVEINPDVYLLS